jgi:hypothetical protein
VGFCDDPVVPDEVPAGDTSKKSELGTLQDDGSSQVKL